MTILIAIIAVILFLAWISYNSLITVKVRLNEAFSQIDVQLKRRADLIPNLLETVKGYAKHEKEIFENVAKARASLMGATNVTDKAKANNQLADTLKSLFAISENYPTLKANENFQQLQEELSDTENKIAYARQFYNSVVMDYNTKLSVFPTIIFANIMHFLPSDFFIAGEAEKKVVQVKF